MTQANVRFFVMVLGNTMDSHKTFLDHLTMSPMLCEVNSLKDSDVIIAFVPIASRVGTDISAAMEKIPEGKPVVLVVLHHTFNEDYVTSDSKFCVNREDVFAVDCLFHEDHGLLRCLRNDDATRAVKNHLIRGNHSEVDHNYYRWIFLVVGIVVGVAVGIGVSVAVGFGVGSGEGIAIGIIVSSVVIVAVIVIWVLYYRQHCTCHTMI